MEKNLEKLSRYEKKWVLQNINITSFLIAINRSNFLFKESFKPRQVNTIYFDNKNFSSISENLDGTFYKKKYRLRWYGDYRNIENPQFEIKAKKGLTTYKKLFPIKIKNKIEFNFDGIEKISKLILNNIKIKFNLFPILTTHYFRYYFISSNKKVRATFDTNLGSSQIYGYKNLLFKKNLENTVLEIKYDRDHDDYVKKNIKNISARMSKSSKYVYSAFEKPKSFYIWKKKQLK